MIKITLKDLKNLSYDECAIQVVGPVKDGNFSPLEAHALGKFIQKVGAIIVSETLDDAISEGEQFNKDERTVLGFEFQIKSNPDTYDFEQDETYVNLNNDLKERRKLLKDSNKMKTRDGVELITEDGEIIPAIPLKKAGGMSIAITLK